MKVGHRAAKTITAQNALEELPFFRGTQPRLYIATATVIHAADEYGQMVEYLRMNGIVPPKQRKNVDEFTAKGAKKATEQRLCCFIVLLIL